MDVTEAEALSPENILAEKYENALKAAPEFDSRLIQGVTTNGYEDLANRRLLETVQIFKNVPAISLTHLLPLLFTMFGTPYTLKDHFPFESYFRTVITPKCVFKAGRQLGKSWGLASRNLIYSLCHPWSRTLMVMPLYEQIRRFSQNYVQSLIETSPVKEMFINDKCVNQLLQKSLINNATLLFNFAGLSADRIRGISVGSIGYDETQDLDPDHIPIIRECMSASKNPTELFGGTSKGRENLLEMLWNDSSQGSWMMRCHKCGKWNIAHENYQLEAMIGPYDDFISESRPGVICAFCRKPRSIFPREGRWIWARPELQYEFRGWHMPQIIFPDHYAFPNKWSTILAKRAGRWNTTRAKFLNEVLGVACDTGARLISMGELQKASILPWTRNLASVAKHCDLSEYTYRVVSADWGGGGIKEDSFSKIAAIGMLPTGEIHVIWGHQSMTPHEHEKEARVSMGIINRFRPQMFVHDYNGAGSLRETFMYQAGWPRESILPITPVRASAVAKILTYKPPSKTRARAYWQMDKARALLLVCNQIRAGRIKFFKFDFNGSDDPGLIMDFVALIDQQIETPSGGTVFTVTRDPHMSDDFAQAVTMGCCALWDMSEKWPDTTMYMPGMSEQGLDEMGDSERELNDLLASSIDPNAIINTIPRNNDLFDDAGDFGH